MGSFPETIIDPKSASQCFHLSVLLSLMVSKVIIVSMSTVL